MQPDFCPRCGGNIFAPLHGACEKICVYCEKTIRCQKLLSKKIDPDSLPIHDQEKAEQLRVKYDLNIKNKMKGKANIAEHKAFYDEAKKNAQLINDGTKKAHKALKNPSPAELKEFPGTLKEFVEQSSANR